MNHRVRAAIAAIAISHAKQQKVSGVHDYSKGEAVNIEVEVRGGRVEGYDYSSSCHVDGDIPDLYHYGQSAHLEFKPLGGGRYEGYDYGSGAHYEVSVSGEEAELYDYGSGGWFTFSR